VKIIATTTSGFICEVSRREIALLGVNSPSIGVDLELERAFDTLSSLRSISRSNLMYLGDQIAKLQEKYKEVESAYNDTMLLDAIKHSEDKK